MNILINPIFSVIVCCIAALVVAIFIEFITLPRVLLISRRKRLYDMPDKRKSHVNPIPRLAGITFCPVILLSFLPIAGLQAIWLGTSSISHSSESFIRLFFMICGILPLVLMGVKDDLIGARYSHKFIIQTLSALLLIASGTYINNLYGLFGIYELSPYIGIPFTALLIVYIINSINLIDGVDGLAASLSISAAAILGIGFIIAGNYTMPILTFSVVGTLIPFLYYNIIARRKLFMGDTGSLTLGYILAFLAVYYSMRNSSEAISTGIPSIIIAWSVLFIPLFDTARVMYTRASQGKSLFHPDRNHIHHKLLDLGFSHRKITLTLTITTLFITACNILLHELLNINLILAIDLIAGILCNVYLNKRKKRRAQSLNKKLLKQTESIPMGDFIITNNYQFDSIPDQQMVIHAIDSRIWLMANEDKELKQALLQSDILVPNGAGITLAARWLTGKQIHNVSRDDLHLSILQHLDKVAGSVFYLGASDRTLALIAERILTEYPNIRVKTYSPPYRDSFSEEETNKMITAINEFKPDVLFIGMSVSKQEKWIATNRHLLHTHLISGIGAVFGFYGGTTSYPPQWRKQQSLSAIKILITALQIKNRKKSIKTSTEYETN